MRVCRDSNNPRCCQDDPSNPSKPQSIKDCWLLSAHTYYQWQRMRSAMILFCNRYLIIYVVTFGWVTVAELKLLTHQFDNRNRHSTTTHLFWPMEKGLILTHNWIGREMTFLLSIWIDILIYSSFLNKLTRVRAAIVTFNKNYNFVLLSLYTQFSHCALHIQPMAA